MKKKAKKLNKNLAIETCLVDGVYKIFVPKKHPKASSIYDWPKHTRGTG